MTSTAALQAGAVRIALLAAAAPVLVLLAAAPVVAEGGPIRTGEHNGFSRIVMEIEPTTEWSLELGSSGEATVNFPARSIPFTTETVWQRIPRTRVTGISTSRGDAGTAVRLSLGCDCRVSASFVGARYLAIDVSDRDAPLAEPAPAPETVQAAADALAAAERLLLAQIQRAAGQGVVELRRPEPAEQPRPTDARDAQAEPTAPTPLPRPTAEAVVAASAPASMTDDEKLLAHLGLLGRDMDHVRATTVFDRDRAGGVQALAPNTECRPEDTFDIARWSDGRPMPDQSADMRRRLVGEFDRPNPAAIRDLARLNIRYGLGTEAGALLRSFSTEIEDAELLADLARVVEGRPAAGPLSRDIACAGRHGLWLALAGQPAMLASKAHFTSLRTAFEELPLELRALLAPALVSRFVAANRLPEARILHDVAVRPGAEPDLAMQLATGRLAAAERRVSDAEAAFAEVAGSGAMLAADATLELVRTRLDAGGTVPAEWITDLQVLAHEHRHGEREPAARALLAEALARNGELREAFAGLARLSADHPNERPHVAVLAGHLLSAADPDAVGHAAFAETALAHEDLLDPEAPGDTARVAVAEKLLNLGLPRAALEVVAPAAERADEGARVVAARALVAMGNGKEAVAELEGLAGAKAARVRAEAHAATGDFAAAAAAAGSGAPEDAAPYAWAAGNWGAVAAASPDPAQAAMASYMQNREEPSASAAVEALTPAAAFATPPSRPEEASLRATRDLLGSGREVSAFIEGLLAKPR